MKALNNGLNNCRVTIWACLVLIFFYPKAYSQNVTISGIITDSKSGETIQNANIFLSNSSYGTQSDDSGKFSLKNVKPGQYELIARYVGYEVDREVVVADEKKAPLNIKLSPKVIELKEVVVKTDLSRARDLAVFKREFIGDDEAARNFKMLNTEIVSITYDPGKLLEASSDEFLVCENKFLGYKINFLLKEFTKNYTPGRFGAGTTYYEGSCFFEELKGSKAQVRRWKKNRLDSYFGSSTHFYRSVLQNKVQPEGFTMYRLVIKDNPDRPADSIIRSKLQILTRQESVLGHAKTDSVEYWRNKSFMPRKLQYLLKDSIETKAVFFKTDEKDIFAIGFPDNLYVTHKGKGQEKIYPTAYRPLDKGGVEATIVSLTDKYIFFDRNGIVVNPKDVIYDGAWATKVTTMLPTDYQPGD